MMENKNTDFKDYLTLNKRGVAASVITAALGYGFLITSVSLSTDDTAFDTYFDHGYSLRMGRLVMTLIQRVLDIVEMTPFWTELIAVLLLVIAGWRIVWFLDQKTEKHINEIFSAAFVCIFISYPLINEIFIYSTMAVSIGLGYVVTVCAAEHLNCFLENGEKKKLVFSIAFLMCAVSLYESFIPVFFCLMLLGMFVEDRYREIRPSAVIKNSLAAIGTAVVAIMINTVLGQICIRIFNLSTLTVPANKVVIWTEQGIGQSIKGVLRTLFYDQFVAGGEYLPILIFVIAVLLLTVNSIRRSFHRKSVTAVLCFAGMYIAAEVIIILQGQTYYRSCQAFSLIVALAGAVLVDKIFQIRLRRLAIAVLCAIILVQTQDLSRWFYLENQCSEAESNLTSNLVADMKKDGLEGKRIAFVFDSDEVAAFDYYASYNSISPNSFLRKGANWLAEKFEYTSTPEFMYQLNRKHNQTNCLTPYLAYGINAFENGVMGPNYELKKYFSPYFFNFEQVTWDEWHEAQTAAEMLESYPSEDYWKDMGDYIIVKVGL